MVARHSGLQFQCFLGARQANQAFCTLARELPNLSLAGFWWHNFFPTVIRDVLSERLDMVPANRQIGFFSDAYCLEWSVAKAELIREVLADVLAERVDRGQYSVDEALAVARQLVHESPQSLLGIEPRQFSAETIGKVS
jgi:glucuronate isomerase